MHIFTTDLLKRAATSKKDGYFDACVKLGKSIAGGHLLFTQDQYDYLSKEFSPQQEPSLPSRGTMLGNLAAATVRIGTAAVTGNQVRRKDDDIEKIKPICRACEFFRASDERCSKCGCNMMGVAGKWQWETEHCPIGKW